MVDTEMCSADSDKSFLERLSNIGMGRLGKPVDIANASVFLGSDLSEYISGQILGVDGCSII
jgi:3-oxoacyl-[acyl-carrier protein] reductase